MTIQCEWSPVVEDDVCRILGFTYFSVRNPCLVVDVFVLKIFRKIQRFVLDPSPSLNTSLKLATSITNITPMHSFWDYVHGMIQHLNWRHRGEVQEAEERGNLWRQHSGSLCVLCGVKMITNIFEHLNTLQLQGIRKTITTYSLGD